MTTDEPIISLPFFSTTTTSTSPSSHFLVSAAILAADARPPTPAPIMTTRRLPWMSAEVLSALEDAPRIDRMGLGFDVIVWNATTLEVNKNNKPSWT